MMLCHKEKQKKNIYLGFEIPNGEGKKMLNFYQHQFLLL